MTRILRSPGFVSALVALTYCLVGLPFVESRYFDPAVTTAQRTLQGTYKVLFFIVLWAVIWSLWTFVVRLRAGSRLHLHWLRAALVYLAVNLVLLWLLYPGYWVWDELFVLDATKHYQIDAWQHIFTQAYYVMCLYVFPTAVSIVGVQILVISAIFGFVYAEFRTVFPRWWQAALVVVPLFFIPVLLNNLYPLRLTLYSYLEVLLVTQVVLLFVHRRESAHPIWAFIGYSLLTGILTTWRTEGAVLLVLLPLIAWRLGLFRLRRTGLAFRALGLVLGVALVSVAFGATRATTLPSYQLTIYVNPLSVMLNEPLGGENLNRNLEAINRVFDVQVLKAENDYTDIPAFFAPDSGLIRPGYEPHVAGMKAAFLDLVKENPEAFLQARSRTFMAANSLDTGPDGSFVPQVGRGWAWFNPTNRGVFDLFDRQNKLSESIDPPVKENVTRTLLLLDDHWRPTPAGAWVWNSVPIVLAMFVVFFLSLTRRRWIVALLVALELGRTAILFLTEPAGFFMYYLPVYMVGALLVFWTIAWFVGGSGGTQDGTSEIRYRGVREERKTA